MPGHDHMFSRIADGDIKCSSVVEPSATDDYMVKQSVGTGFPFGISQEWIQGAPGTPFAKTPGNIAAENKRPIMIYGPGSICPAAQKANAPAIPAGAAVKSDANGFLVIAAAGDNAVGWVQESSGTKDLKGVVVTGATTDGRLRVFVYPHVHGGAGTQSLSAKDVIQGAQGAQGPQGNHDGAQGAQGSQGAQGTQGEGAQGESLAHSGRGGHAASGRHH